MRMGRWNRPERFAGRTAIITGAGIGGLGAAYANALAAGGASVVVTDIRGPEVEATAEGISRLAARRWRWRRT